MSTRALGRVLCLVFFISICFSLPSGSQAQSLYTISDLGNAQNFPFINHLTNRQGQIAGSLNGHITRTTGNLVESLRIEDESDSRSEGINESGQIVGEYVLADHPPLQPGSIVFDYYGHAVRWTGLVGEDLGTLYKGLYVSFSAGYGINDLGQVVGKAAGVSGYDVAFLYTQGQMFDLNTLVSANSGWNLYRANHINNQGTITGWGMLNGQNRAFLLSPVAVPEPSSFALLGAIGLMSALRKRRSR